MSILDRIIIARPKIQDWATSLGTTILLGFAIVGYYGFRTGEYSSFATSMVVSGACLVVGILIGFLFGIPRSLQSEGPPDTKTEGAQAASARIQYRANTNLEQISDWLTKILVGVGLTQLGSISAMLVSIGGYLGPALGSGDRAARLAIAIIIFFLVCGFLFGYLWTRLFLGGELAKADLNAVTQQVREIAQAQEEQSQLDAKAIALVTRYLTDTDRPKIAADELKASVESASAPVKVQVFYQARNLRSQSSQSTETKPLIERTIPIFEALIASDSENRFHQNHAQLGYALKDKRQPDYSRAESELTAAINIRGPASNEGFELYEFNRAICRIRQDVDFQQNKPSTPERQKEIFDDLKISHEGWPELTNPETEKWLALNGLKVT